MSYNENFSEVDFDKLSKKKTRFKTARTRTIEETASLNRRIETSKKAQDVMIARESRTLKELERKKRSAQQFNTTESIVLDE